MTRFPRYAVQLPLLFFFKLPFVKSIKETNRDNLFLLFKINLLMFFSIQLNAAVYYVSPDGSYLSDGSKDSPWSLLRANASLQPGDTAILLDGIYTGTPIAPVSSGMENAPIIYQAENQHMAVFHDIVELPDSRGPVAIFVNNRGYIKVDGIKVSGVKRWLMGVASHHITLSNGYFENASGWINCRFEENGDGIHIQNNYFHGGTDLVSLDGGNGHLVEDNFFGDASHTGLVLLGVQRSVVRNNFLTNRLWRCMEVESQRHEPYRLSMYNLIEDNTFDYSPCKSIQYAGNRSILRRNIFRKSLMGMGWANYLGSAKTPEAWHDESNRFYNNVITECGSQGIVFDIIAENQAKGIEVAETVSTAGYGMVYSTNLFNPPVEGYDDCAYGDNIVKNNIFYMNGNTSEPKSANTSQIAFDWNATPEFGMYHYNNIHSGAQDAEVFYYADAVYEDPPEARNRTLQSFEERYPDRASNNIDVDPEFVNPGEGNYRLSQTSLCIDAGGALSKTISSGKGIKINVEDVLYFTDGHDLVEPDVIRVDSQRVQVVKIDYDSNAITISESISWQKDAPVTLDYEGNAPDMGAFEYNSLTNINREVIDQNVYGSFKLFQNYPNPFNPKTRIDYELPITADVEVHIYSLLGQKLETLVSKKQQAGKHQVEWDAREFSSGVYYYMITAGDYQYVRKMIVIR
jgi:hypothetical protein